MRLYATPVMQRKRDENDSVRPRKPRANFAQSVLDLQRRVGNRAVTQMLQRHFDDPSHIKPSVLSGPVIQRDDDPPDPQDGTQTNPPHKDPITSPGGPVDTGDKGVQFGWVNGKPQISVDLGKGDPLQYPGQGPPEANKGTIGPDSKKAASCPGRYAFAFDQCCKDGFHVSDNGALCVRDKEQDLSIPPAEPEQKGDFPSVSPGPDEAYS